MFTSRRSTIGPTVLLTYGLLVFLEGCVLPISDALATPFHSKTHKLYLEVRRVQIFDKECKFAQVRNTMREMFNLGLHMYNMKILLSIVVLPVEFLFSKRTDYVTSQHRSERRSRAKLPRGAGHSQHCCS